MKNDEKVLIAITGLTFGQSCLSVLVNQIIYGLLVTLFIEIPFETNASGLKIITFFAFIIYYFTADKSKKLIFSDDKIMYNAEVEIPYDNIEYVHIKNVVLFKNFYVYKKGDANPVINHIAIKNLDEVLVFLENKKVKISEKKI